MTELNTKKYTENNCTVVDTYDLLGYGPRPIIYDSKLLKREKFCLSGRPIETFYYENKELVRHVYYYTYDKIMYDDRYDQNKLCETIFYFPDGSIIMYHWKNDTLLKCVSYTTMDFNEMHKKYIID